MKNLEFTVFCKPESLWQQQMLLVFFQMNNPGMVNSNTVTVKKKTRHQKGWYTVRYTSVQVYKSIFVLLVFKKTFMPLGRSWWTAGLLPRKVCLSCGLQAGSEEGASPAPTLTLPFSWHTEGDRTELQQQSAGPRVNPGSGKPKGICHHPHPSS